MTETTTPRTMQQPRKSLLREHLIRAAERIEAQGAEIARLRREAAIREAGLVARLRRWVRA